METNFTEMDRIVTVMKFYSATHMNPWVPLGFIAEHLKRDRASLASVLDEMLRLGMIDSHEIRSNGRTAVYYCLDQHRESPRDVESRIFFHGRHQEKRRVRISDVTVHECLQQRNRVVNADAVARYVLDMEKGCVFPPVELYQMPGGRLILVDGYHRLQAASSVRTLHPTCRFRDVRKVAPDGRLFIWQFAQSYFLVQLHNTAVRIVRMKRSGIRPSARILCIRTEVRIGMQRPCVAEKCLDSGRFSGGQGPPNAGRLHEL